MSGAWPVSSATAATRPPGSPIQFTKWTATIYLKDIHFVAILALTPAGLPTVIPRQRIAINRPDVFGSS
jgi:hypothetical protein